MTCRNLGYVIYKPLTFHIVSYNCTKDWKTFGGSSKHFIAATKG